MTETTTPTGAKTPNEIEPTSLQNEGESTDFRSPRNKRLGRENYEEKARRLLAEARLNVTRVDREADVYEAQVRGDSAEVYAVEWLRDSARWFCPCEARGICSHIRAMQLIVVRS